MKKIFRLSAMVAMISMMATAVCVSSCSDDDEEDEPEPTPVVKGETFTLEVGGSKSTKGSFISIQDKAVYTSSDITKGLGENVEIVFNGKSFLPVSSSENETVKKTAKEKGITAVIEEQVPNKEFNFTTNGGKDGKSYSGTIVVTSGEMGTESATITIKVTRK